VYDRGGLTSASTRTGSTAVTDSTQYEFTSNQNQLIGSLGGKMRLVGLVMMIMGICTLVMAAMIAIGGQSEAKLKELPQATFWSIVGYYVIAGLFYLLLGSWTRSSGGSFQQMVSTRGQDISRLMDALGSLHKIYSVLYILCIVAIILFVALVVAGIAGTFLMAK
jgi:hypothetical protein